MRYVNPKHPAGDLHPQPAGPGMGGRTGGARARDAFAQKGRLDRDPVVEVVLEGEGEKEAWGRIVLVRQVE